MFQAIFIIHLTHYAARRNLFKEKLAWQFDTASLEDGAEVHQSWQISTKNCLTELQINMS